MDLASTGRNWVRTKFRAVLVATTLSVAVAVVGCRSAETAKGGGVGADRQQSALTRVTQAQIRAGAVQAYAEDLAIERGNGALDADAVMTGRVRTIADRLIAVTDAFRPDAPGWEWEVHLIRSDRENAWCMPGGKIAVYSGLITKFELTDDEIAAVLAHLIAHALREHARERASELLDSGAFVEPAVAAPGAGQGTIDMARLVNQVTLSLPYGRVYESEADRRGVELAARAGYDPRASIRLWQKMAGAGGDREPEWSKMHPSDGSRIRELGMYSARGMPLYEQARRWR
jgi:predicted Zn-dependent protease